MKIKEFVGENISEFHLSETTIKTLDVSGPILLNIWNKAILKDCAYPDKLKLADVFPVYKKENPLLAKNYRPVSVLPTVTKIFERLMQS